MDHAREVVTGEGFVRYIHQRTRRCAKAALTVFVSLLPFTSSAVLYVDADASGVGDGTSWSNAFTTVPAALAAATSGVEIWVSAGIYHPGSTRGAAFQLKEDVSLYGGFTGEETNRADRDWTTNVVVLSGDIGASGVATDNVFHVVLGADNAILDGFTISHGYADGTNHNQVAGAGILNAGVSPTLLNCTFTDNFARPFGSGGAVCNVGASPIISNCVFIGNSAYWGGAICNKNGGTPVIEDSEFFSNTADYGGGIHNEDSSPTIRRSVFKQNSGEGAGLSNRGGSPTVDACVFADGTAYQWNGGGVRNAGGTPTIENTLFTGNVATKGQGAGLFNHGAALILMNATLHGNKAQSDGGGLYNAQANIDIVNTVLWSNAAPSGAEVFNSNGILVVMACAMQSGVNGSKCDGDALTDGGANISADPAFENESDPDGADNILRTWDDGLAISWQSPCRDVGDTNAAPSWDIVDVTRPQVWSVDIGAYEYDWDPDHDGLNNQLEALLGSNPRSADSDGDGVSDADEYFVHGTDPAVADTDGDGMPDGWEIAYGLDPTMDDASEDRDLDWLTNLQEYLNSLDPTQPDTSPDGTNDFVQVYGKSGGKYTYDRLDRLVGVEYERGRSIAYTYDGNGNLLRQLYLDRDEDGDGLLDLWEFLNGLSWTNGTGTQGMLGDPDGDGWSNYQELMGQSSPTSGTSTPDVYGPAGSTASVFQVAFTPDNFVMAVGQLDGMLGEEIVVGADGNPGGTNSLLILSEQSSGWTTETVPIGEYGFTSISIGQPTNATQAAIYVGLRSGTGTGAVMQVKQAGGTWEKTLIASSTSEVAYVVGVRDGQDVVASLDTTNNPAQCLVNLIPSTTNWAVSVLNTNTSHRGLGLLVSTNEASPASTPVRLLDTGGIQIHGSPSATIIPEPTATSRLLWRGKSLASGHLRAQGSQCSLLHALINDVDSSGLPNEGDEFILTEFQLDGVAWTTQTLSRVVLDRGPSYTKPYALAAVDFTNGTCEIVFTGEPDGSVYSWRPQGGTGALERALFTSRYQGKTWHQIESHAGLQVGKGLVGLQVDPSSPHRCRVIYWKPERALWTPASIRQTAPLTRVMADPNRGGGYAAVGVKLWDAEGNAALPILQYEDPVSSNWVDASVAQIDGFTYSYAMAVEAMPTGSLHHMLWNAGSDLGLDFTNAVHLRARSADMSAWGAWSDPVLYRIDATTDSDRDGLPDSWELTHGLNLLSASGDDGADADIDGDTFSNFQEYIADTDPRDIESLLIITGVYADGALIKVDWKGGQQSWQYLRYRPNLTDTGYQWSAIFTNHPPTETTNSIWIDMGTNRTGMFRIEAER